MEYPILTRDWEKDKHRLKNYCQTLKDYPVNMLVSLDGLGLLQHLVLMLSCDVLLCCGLSSSCVVVCHLVVLWSVILLCCGLLFCNLVVFWVV